MALLWHLDEPGEPATCADSAAHRRSVPAVTGTVLGGVRGGAESPAGTAFEGFASPESGIRASVAGKGRAFFPDRWTLLLWIRDPLPRPDRPALLARGGAEDPSAPVAWQVAVRRDGAVALWLREADPKGRGAKPAKEWTFAGKPLDWSRGVWRQVAIAQERTFDKETRAFTARFRVWVTPEGDEPGEPTIDETVSGHVGLAPGATLCVGAAPEAPGAPAAALSGALDEVSFWPEVLSDEERARQASLFSVSAAALDAGASTAFFWRLEEPGQRPSPQDSSGNGRGGTSGHRVRGGVPGRNGSRAYDGFTSEESRLAALLPAGTFRGDWTFLACLRAPRLSNKQACVIARGGDAARGLAGWQLWLDARGAPHVSLLTSGSKRGGGTGDPMRWDATKWYRVALAHAREKSRNGDKVERFRFYAAPDGAPFGAPALEWTWTSGGAMNPGDQLFVGASPAAKGKQAEWAPGGFFGGQIDDVAFLTGVAAAAGDLDALFKGAVSGSAPEPERDIWAGSGY